MVAGVLCTGGGLVFTGDAEGFFTAYEAQTGKVLWTFQCGSGHHSGPITYSLDGRQYIAVWAVGRLDGRIYRRGTPLRNARRGQHPLRLRSSGSGKVAAMAGILKSRAVNFKPQIETERSERPAYLVWSPQGT